MLPVALTCPLWWVARWASRLLAGLALTAGLTFGGTGPAHAAGAVDATGAFATVAPAADSTRPTADGERCAGGSAPGITSATRSAVDEASSGWLTAVAVAVPHGSARPAPATGGDSVRWSDRSGTTSGPRAPPLS